MATHAETRNRFCQADGVFERAPVGHQRGGGHDSASMGLDDGAIDARGEAKVIGIDDQTAHGVSLAGGETCLRISEIAVSHSYWIISPVCGSLSWPEPLATP